MSLAYALEAAINTSTGPHATLSHGLSAHQASTASIRASGFSCLTTGRARPRPLSGNSSGCTGTLWA